MSTITTRQQFKDYCLRRLGFPVIDINVDDDQIEDRIDDALLYWQDYHFDGLQKVYYVHQLTQQDIDNKYISILYGDSTSFCNPLNSFNFFWFISFFQLEPPGR